MTCSLCGLTCLHAYGIRGEGICTNCVTNLAEWALHCTGHLSQIARAWAIKETRREAKKGKEI